MPKALKVVAGETSALKLFASASLTSRSSSSARSDSPKKDCTCSRPRLKACALKLDRPPSISKAAAASQRHVAGAAAGSRFVMAGELGMVKAQFFSKIRSMRRSGSAAPHKSWSPTVKAPT